MTDRIKFRIILPALFFISGTVLFAGNISNKNKQLQQLAFCKKWDEKKFQSHLAFLQKLHIKDKEKIPDVLYLGENWNTQGNWIGNYGNYTWACFAMRHANSFFGGTGIKKTGITAYIGANIKRVDGIRLWMNKWNSKSINSLQNPVDGGRTQSEIDDHGEAYSGSVDGPHIYIDVTVPEGMFRLSLYFNNKDGHWGPNKFRDYVISIFRKKTDLPVDKYQNPLASCFLHEFRNGVYKQFSLKGPGTYLVKIDRNSSFNTILPGLFLDKMEPDLFYYDDLHMGQPSTLLISSPETKLRTLPVNIGEATVPFADICYKRLKLLYAKTAYLYSDPTLQKTLERTSLRYLIIKTRQLADAFKGTVLGQNALLLLAKSLQLADYGIVFQNVINEYRKNAESLKIPLFNSKLALRRLNDLYDTTQLWEPERNKKIQ